MIKNTEAKSTHSRFLGFRYIIFLGTIFVTFPLTLSGQTFKSTAYQNGSKTAGIQEAIDAAAKGGGGTVQIPVGTFVVHAAAGQPAIILRSRVNVVGAGPDNTILKLEANSKTFPAVIVNQKYDNPDVGEPDHDITLQGFTVDVALSDQVLRETQLAEAIPAGGEQKVVLQSAEPVGAYPMLRIEPGTPNEEIVPVIKISSGSLRTPFRRPHPAGSKVVMLTQRLHGLALVGAHNVTIENVTFQNAPMDGIYLASTVTPVRHHTYCRGITIQHSDFVGCRRNGISVIDADDVSISYNHFRDITGGGVDVEPNGPEQHGNRINIVENQVEKTFSGINLSLQFSGPTSENFREETIVGNTIQGTLYQGIYILWQQAGATISGNTITDSADDAISVIGSSHLQITNNIITNAGRCQTPGNCPAAAKAVGIRLADGMAAHILMGNVITGNTVEDQLHVPALLYGIDFSSTGQGNTIKGNTVSRIDPHRGMVVHVSGKAESNSIRENVRK
jgi:parallel beta-helix repeat protein